MTTVLSTRRKLFGSILPLDEVKYQAIVDALDQCDGNHLLAARLLRIGRNTIYRMERAHKSQHHKTQGETLVVVFQYSPSQCNTPR
jgi:transcriptional regulator of acetoin/glycerol metabolism